MAVFDTTFDDYRAAVFWALVHCWGVDEVLANARRFRHSDEIGENVRHSPSPHQGLKDALGPWMQYL